MSRRVVTAFVVTLAVAGASIGLDAPADPASAASPPTVAIGDAAVSEGNAGLTPARLAVRLSDPVAADTVVRFTTSGGSATPVTDYRSRTGTVRIRAGRTRAFVTIQVIGDSAAEPEETTGVVLTDTGGVTIRDGNATVTIRDDEQLVGVSIGDAAVWEGDTGTGLAKLTVVLDAPAVADVLVHYGTADGGATAPSDYRARTGRVRIRAGRTLATVTLTTFGDLASESDEVFGVSLLGTGTSGVPVARGAGTVTVRDDDRPPAPGAPSDLAVVAGPLPRYLTATWALPAGPEPITGYDVEVVRGATVNVLAGVSSPLELGCGLAQVSDTCTVRVRARNAGGEGPWSDPVAASTWAVPEAPANLALLAGGGAVSWDAPASDRPIEHYEVQQSTDGGGSWAHVAAPTTTYVGISCTVCTIRVSAYSEVGLGDWATLAVAPPGPPTGLAGMRDATDHELVHLVWSLPTDPGSHPVESYEVFVNGFPLPTTTATALDVRLRSTLVWQVEVWARSIAGRGLIPATLTIAAG